MAFEHVNTNNAGDTILELTQEEFDALLPGSRIGEDNLVYANEVVVDNELNPDLQETSGEEKKAEEEKLQLQAIPDSNPATNMKESENIMESKNKQKVLVDAEAFTTCNENRMATKAELKYDPNRNENNETTLGQKTIHITHVENEEQLLEELLDVEKFDIDAEEKIQKAERLGERTRQRRNLDELMKLIGEARNQF